MILITFAKWLAIALALLLALAVVLTVALALLGAFHPAYRLRRPRRIQPEDENG